ncbi:hypothetical protein V5O48_011659 [Marasmius crinis-equi]|uniref:Uncharacterized protein n=1 Tax=Marasmius crinis-equi TaxID=585013 RepID=A0ABR3F518_9AGAR
MKLWLETFSEEYNEAVDEVWREYTAIIDNPECQRVDNSGYGKDKDRPLCHGSVQLNDCDNTDYSQTQPLEERISPPSARTNKSEAPSPAASPTFPQSPILESSSRDDEGPPLSRGAPYFANAHGFIIESGKFATVRGNQILNYFNREPERKTAPTIYDQGCPVLTTHKYHQVLMGDICRTQDLGFYRYLRLWDRTSIKWSKRGVRADRVICTAQLCGREGREFTVVSYTGPDAQEAFENDFRTYSRSLTGPFQIYGINTSVPTILFYEERQPAACFVDSLGFWGKVYLEVLRRVFCCAANEIWLDTKKGELTRGPVGPDFELHVDVFGLDLPVVPESAEHLHDDIFLRYLARQKSKDVDRSVVNGIAWLYTPGVSQVEVHQSTIFSKSTNATVANSGGLWEKDWSDCLGEREVTENGETK